MHFLGFVPETTGVLRGADVFVSSSWAESFPYVVLDAMALGRPIVATRVGGVAEAVQRRRVRAAGARHETPGRSRGRVARLVSDPAEAAAMGARARSLVAAQFSRERMLEGLAAVFRDVIS